MVTHIAVILISFFKPSLIEQSLDYFSAKRFEGYLKTLIVFVDKEIESIKKVADRWSNVRKKIEERKLFSKIEEVKLDKKDPAEVEKIFGKKLVEAVLTYDEVYVICEGTKEVVNVATRIGMQLGVTLIVPLLPTSRHEGKNFEEMIDEWERKDEQYPVYGFEELREDPILKKVFKILREEKEKDKVAMLISLIAKIVENINKRTRVKSLEDLFKGETEKSFNIKDLKIKILSQFEGGLDSLINSIRSNLKTYELLMESLHQGSQKKVYQPPHFNLLRILETVGARDSLLKRRELKDLEPNAYNMLVLNISWMLKDIIFFAVIKNEGGEIKKPVDDVKDSVFKILKKILSQQIASMIKYYGDSVPMKEFLGIAEECWERIISEKNHENRLERLKIKTSTSKGETYTLKVEKINNKTYFTGEPNDFYIISEYLRENEKVRKYLEFVEKNLGESGNDEYGREGSYLRY